MLKNQKFGVEIEMTGITRAAAAKVVATVLHSHSSDPTSGCYHTRSIQDEADRIWKIMRDSSIREMNSDGGYENDEYKVEFVTPPLQYDDLNLLQDIVRELKKAGAITNESCGIHVHVDGANHNPQSLRRLVNFMTARQDLIYEALEIGSRANHWCQKLNSNLLTAMKSQNILTSDKIEAIWYSKNNDDYNGGIDHQHYNDTRYHGVNLHSYFTKKTVEFRLFNSTLHDGKIKAYIQFCLAISAWSIESTDHVIFHSMAGYTANQKVTIMRNILTHRLGLTGAEFKVCRLHILAPLKKAAGQINREAA